ncbi:dUTP diphosphatase [Deferribacter desulfuricans]|uniref:dUTP diphosphatase n=1 Tax=Deferribacter desulfuricans TaxID=197162 RepID=UPI001E337971|nr:dUTP diphosphatase [Deferribacter desulfuricans]
MNYQKVTECPVYNVRIKKIHPDAQIPQYATNGSSGFDFYTVEEIVIQPKETKLIKTGLQIALPIGYELQIRPRSGLSLKTPLRVANTPGTVDADYRGEICILVWNTEDKPITIEKGTRIAQGVICKIEQVNFIETDELDDTDRGDGGFGSTGVK